MHMRASLFAIVVTAVPALVVAGCSSSGSAGAPSANPGGPNTAGSQSSPVVEVHPPGDIPDNQAFVRYGGAGFTVTVPEGWARTSAGGAVAFTDKYNRITLATVPAKSAPTVQSATTTEVASIKAASRGFVAGKVRVVSRPAGQAVLITYQVLSPVNPVTGKVANEAVERYEFWRNGKEAVITLAAPVGSDNVDPWRTITDSFAWTHK